MDIQKLLSEMTLQEKLGQLTFITATDGKVYSMEFNDGNEAIVLAKVGSVLHVSYFTDAETQIRRINTWSFPNP